MCIWEYANGQNTKPGGETAGQVYSGFYENQKKAESFGLSKEEEGGFQTVDVTEVYHCTQLSVMVPCEQSNCALSSFVHVPSAASANITGVVPATSVLCRVSGPTNGSVYLFITVSLCDLWFELLLEFLGKILQHTFSENF